MGGLTSAGGGCITSALVLCLLVCGSITGSDASAGSGFLDGFALSDLALTLFDGFGFGGGGG